MKNKKTVLIISGVAIVAVLAIVFTQLRTPASDQTPIDIPTIENQKLSLKELMARGVSQKCTVRLEDENYKSSTETWIKGNKIRQIATIEGDSIGKKVTNFLSDGVYMYSWDEETKSGMKIKIEEAESEGASEASIGMNLDMDEKLSYDCQETQIDDKVFTLPSDVKITDFNAETEKLKDQLENFNVEEYMHNLPSNFGE